MLEFLETFQEPLETIKVFAANVPIGIQIYNAEGYTIFVNDGHRRIFGAAPPADYCVFKDNLVEAAGLLHLVKKAFSGERAMLPIMWYDPADLQGVDTEYTKKYGKKCAIETQMIPVFGPGREVTNVIFVFRDVTGEFYMQKERDDAKILVQSVLDQTPAVVYIKDSDGKFIFANNQFRHIFNKTNDELLNKTDYDLVPKEQADAFRKNDLQVLNTNAPLEIEETAAHADGTTHTYLSLKFPLYDSAGALYGVCGISTDISRYRALERELNTAKRMEAVGLLAGGIAHNFNNNLGIILLLTQALLMPDAKKKLDFQQSVKSIQAAAQSAALLTRQLLAFGRRQQFQAEIIDVKNVINGMADILKSALSEDIKFVVNVAPDLWSVLADPAQIEQILTNLCFNARDSMGTGGVLSVSAQNVTYPSSQKAWVKITVADTGAGIKPELLERIFEPFFTTKNEHEGTGLGLSTVYGIVQSLGGEITVDSIPGEGSAFHVLVPKSEKPAPREDTAPASKGGRSLEGKETILLVEDENTLRALTATLLKTQGYKVIERKDAASALRDWPGLSKSVDVIIADIVMPGMSGLEMTQKMAQTGRPQKKSKVLFISAYAGKKLSDYGFKEGHFQFVQKPYTPEQLLTRLRAVLDQ